MDICLSHSASWNYVRKLTDEARYLQVIRSRHWLWVLDDLNIHHRIHHEREGHVIVLGTYSNGVSLTKLFSLCRPTLKDNQCNGKACNKCPKSTPMGGGLVR